MKSLIMGLMVLSFSATAFSSEDSATDTRTYKKLNSNEAVVTITTTEDYAQAVLFVDGLEGAQFMKDMSEDKKSELAKAIKAIELENCDEVAAEALGYIDGCGSVEISGPVQISFGRGGWASAYQSSAYFVGFRHDGTGQYLQSSYMVQVSEGVEAQTDVTGQFNGTLLKSYSLDSVKKLETQN